MEKISIISDGTLKGTKVFDANGNQIHGVQKIEILPITIDNFEVSAKLTLSNIEFLLDNVEKKE